MKILIVGLGSIGRRHLENILSLGYTSVAAVSGSSERMPDGIGLPVFKSIGDALRYDYFDAAVICSPTAFHVQQLIALLEGGVRSVYVEKPLSHSLANLDEVLQTGKPPVANVVVGYDLRFDPGIEKIKEWLQRDRIGKIITANAFVGQYLPQWRPDKDHRKGMSAKKETGGGVMLDLIHEADYLHWLFGNVETVSCNYLNTGVLEIATEEAAEMLLKFSGGVIGTIHLDYWQPELKRFCIFTGTNGVIHWDLVQQTVLMTHLDGTREIFAYPSFGRNDRFVSIIKAFLEDTKDSRLTRLSEAVESLKIILAAKHAAENECVVRIAEWSMINP